MPVDVAADACPACELTGALSEEAQETSVVAFSPSARAEALASANTPDRDSVRIFGDYEILEEIARGGMGVVYKARQISLNRIVALKMILGGLATKELILRFRTEASTAANLHHPNIVAIHEVGVHEGEHFIAMDYVDGPNLAKAVGQEPPPPRQAALHLKAIAQAIQFAHDRNILHRDLKPANILIDANGQPQVTDFGLAKRLDSDTDLTHTGQVLGSPNYIPPEQVKGSRHRVGRSSDVYGLGGILYFLLTARAPYQAETFADLVHQVLHAEPLPPRALNPRVPRDLETICLKCLEKEPTRRYASAHDVERELERFLADEPIKARPAGGAERTWRWCRRKPGLAVALASVVALLAVIVIGAPVAIFRIERERLRAEKEANLARYGLYLADMSLAQQAIQEGNLGRARSLLLRHQSNNPSDDFRGWEWFHFSRESQGDELAILGQHASEVAGLAVSPDGQWLASVGAEGDALLWSAATLKIHAHWKVEGRITALSFAPDSQSLALLSHPGGCRIWTLSPPRETAHFPVPQSYFSGALAYAPTGETLAISRGDGTVELWNLKEKARQAELAANVGSVIALTFDPAGQMLIIAGDSGKIRLKDIKTQEEVGLLEGGGGYLASLVLSPDGSQLAFASYNGTVRVWDLASRQLKVALTNHTAAVMAVAFSPDRTRLASAGADQTIRFWNTTNWQPAGLLRGHDSAVRAIAFLRDGQTLASGGSDRTLRLWHATPRAKAVPSIQLSNHVASIGILPHRRQAAAVSWNGQIHMFDLSTLQEVGVIQLSIDTSDVWGGATFLSGTPLAIGNHLGFVALCDAEHLREVASFQAHSGRIRSLTVSPQGKTAATMGEDGKVRLWDLDPAPRLRAEREASGAFWMSFSPDGRTLAATLENGSIALWNASTLNDPVQFAGHQGAAVGTAFTPDSRLLATASWDGSAKVWDMATHQLVTTVQSQFLGVNNVAFSPDGRRLAVGSQDGSIKFWDTLLWQEVATIRAHSGEVWDIAFLPSDNTFVSASRSDLRVWPIQPKALDPTGGPP